MSMREGRKFHLWSDEFKTVVDKYLEKEFATEAVGDEICCPCKFCDERFWYSREAVRDHLLCKGFTPRLEKELESMIKVNENRVPDNEHELGSDQNIDMEGLLRDIRKGPNEEAKKFYKLIEDGEQDLYPGCKNFSKLSFTIRLFLYKSDHNLSNAAFDDLLQLIKSMQPDANLPNSFNEAKNVLKVLGLNYTKIDACPNDCMLYWEEHADATVCHVCNTSRWKSEESGDTTENPRQIPAKILRYFPLKSRLQRLFMSPETALHMTWHAKRRENDGMLKHPADAKAWQDFDLEFSEFAKDPRNVRLGLATDGFSPFNNMSIVHSTWPVLLTILNLPPQLAMKPEFFMLSLLIPGPFSPGNDLDIYMQPLIKDLQELWKDGLETYDAASDELFDMKAALVTTISDFPGYAMVSGWSTKGRRACPCCHYETCSQYLNFSGKYCYMGHRRFLGMDHPWRYNRRLFYGEIEEANEPVRLQGIEKEELLSDFKHVFGKTQKPNADPDVPWKKKPSLFNLPYWKHVSCPHNLDVMHIEKNVFDSVIGTLLDIPGKTKDHLKARKDLKEMGRMPELHPEIGRNGKEQCPHSRFWLSPDKKRTFCQIMKNAKVPQGYASNIKRYVQVRERRITGYKSHDAHFMMQHLLPIAAATTLDKEVAIPLIKLSAFFKSICKKSIDPRDLRRLQSDIVETLCELETIFPPSFFDIMVHLPVHLVEEIKLGGPVTLRWMYSIERYLRKLKLYVRNKSRPEASMAEAYLSDECVAFCARYMRRRPKSHCFGDMTHESNTPTSTSLFSDMGHPIKGRGRTRKTDVVFRMDELTWTQAHRYVLFNCDNEDVKKYLSEHETSLNSQRKRKWSSAQIHSREFTVWFKDKVDHELQQGQLVADHVLKLSRGPSFIARRFTGYFVNGYKFHTRKRDANCVTQNSGVSLSALTQSFASRKDQNPILGGVMYYGSIEDIIEIRYPGDANVVLFRCVWFQTEMDECGLMCVNFNKSIYEGEPFILASQADQVFYVEVPTKEGWQYAIEVSPKDLSDDIKGNCCRL